MTFFEKKNISKYVLGTIFFAATVTVSNYHQQAFAQRWEANQGASREQEIIRRYLSILEKNPTRGFAFRQVLSRVGTGNGLKKLIKTYQEKIQNDSKNPVLPTILGHFLVAANRLEEALEAYNNALKIDPKNADALLGRGEVLLSSGKHVEASQDFQLLLENESDKRKKQEVLRKLADISFANRDWKSAENYYDQLVNMNPKDAFLRAEYADVLRKYNRNEKAIEQYEAIMKLNAGNSKRRAETYRDLGDVYQEMNQLENAVQNYEKGMKLVRPSVWLYRELQHRIIDTYRRQNKLPELVKRLTKEYGSLDFQEAMIMGQLYEELGDDSAAKTAFQTARRLRPRDPDPRVRIIRILERAGDDRQIVKEYNDLTRVAPTDAENYFQLAKLHVRAGRKKEAIKVFKKIEAKFASNPDVVAQLGDAYVEYDMEDDALRAYKKLLRSDPKNDAYILSLAEQYYRMGHSEEAVDTWTLLLKSNLDETEANVRLGQVLAEHGMTGEALGYFQNALEKSPNNVNVRRGIAMAYERVGRGSDALESWEWIYDHTDQPEIMYEARRQMVRILAKYGTLRQQVERAEQRFKSNPNDYKSGLLAAQGYQYEGDNKKAESILKKIVETTEGKEQQRRVRQDTMLTLVRSYETNNRLQDAIALLKKLAAESPLKKRAYYDRIAELSLQRFETDDAIQYAKLVIDANPDDAQAISRLGDIYMRMGELELASQQFENAAKVDPQAWDAVYKLAEAQRELGDEIAATENYKRVLQYSRDDQMVENSARKLIRLATATGNLGSIEQEIYQLAFRPPRRDSYTLIALDYYQWLVGPMIMELEVDGAENRDLREELDSLGRRISPILVDAINSKNINLQYRAIRLAAELRARAVLNALTKIASDYESKLQPEAVRALVLIGDKRGIATLARLASSKDERAVILGDWALGFFDDDAATKILEKQLKNPHFEALRVARAMAIVGLARREKSRNLLNKLNLNGSFLYQYALAWGLSLNPEADPDLLKSMLSIPLKEISTLAAIGLGISRKNDAIAELVGAYYGDDDAARSAAAVGLGYASQPTLGPSRDFDAEAALIAVDPERRSIENFLSYMAQNRIDATTSNDSNLPFEFQNAYIKGVAGKISKQELARRIVKKDFEFQFGPVSLAPSDPRVLDLARAMIRAGEESTREGESVVVDVVEGRKGAKDLREILVAADSLLKKVEALYAASFLEDGEAKEIFVRAAEDPNDVVRAVALRGLTVRIFGNGVGKGGEVDGKLLRQRLRDPSKSVRMEALRLATKLKSSEILPEIQRLIDNPLEPTGISRATVDYLVALNSPKSKALAKKLTHHPDVYVRQHAKKLLAQ